MADVKKIEEKLLAPCCWKESLAVHRSPEAEKMRGEIARMVEGGKTEGEIVEFYVGKYGERILREPRGQRAVWLAVAPVVFVLAGLMVLLLFLRKQMMAKGAEA